MQSNKWQIIVPLVIVFFSSTAKAACDCGSVDSANPCTGQSIAVTVKAGTPNGGTALDNAYKWTFNSEGGDARCGQFANGDYWIAPAENKSDITITEISSTSHPTLITADINPHPGKVGLLDGSPAWSKYDSAENIIPLLPTNISTARSIVAAIQRDEAREGACGAPSTIGSCVDSYHVITVLTSVPENAGNTVLRPNIAGETKELISLSELDLTRVPEISFFPTSTAIELADITRRWSHSVGSIGVYWSTNGTIWHPTTSENVEEYRAYNAHILIGNYGAGAANMLHNDIARIFSSNIDREDKIQPLAAILAYGLDLYHAIYSTSSGYYTKWGTGAGQHLGRYTAPVLLAALEKDGSRGDILRAVPATVQQSLQPQELAQLHSGPHGVVWGDDEGITRYWTELAYANCYDGQVGICNASYGQKTAKDPYHYIDGPAGKPGTSYFPIGYAGILNFAAIMHMMPEFRSVVNSSKPLEFVARAKTHGLKTLPDPCVTPDSREVIGEASCNVWFSGTGCQYYYPTGSVEKTWGAKSLSDATAGCVTDVVSGGYTQAGRFASLDGTTAIPNTSYVSSTLNANWASISQMNPRRLFRNVRLHMEVE